MNCCCSDDALMAALHYFTFLLWLKFSSAFLLSTSFSRALLTINSTSYPLLCLPDNYIDSLKQEDPICTGSLGSTHKLWLVGWQELWYIVAQTVGLCTTNHLTVMVNTNNNTMLKLNCYMYYNIQYIYSINHHHGLMEGPSSTCCSMKEEKGYFISLGWTHDI